VGETEGHSFGNLEGFSLSVNSRSTCLTYFIEKAVQVDVYRVTCKTVEEDVLAVTIPKTEISAMPR
jgi:hypothetical protein